MHQILLYTCLLFIVSSSFFLMWSRRYEEGLFGALGLLLCSCASAVIFMLMFVHNVDHIPYAGYDWFIYGISLVMLQKIVNVVKPFVILKLKNSANG